ncbi:hypothetical protein [Flavobacterium sp. TAB 87]|uniref:hypothetical protein n=1 Tax=Flavobacterium sp. TAB 87 TaxID=1729581 RepID=UPI00076C5E66|nr:hypothetical protein [Flavobacterium sp. TAB 87]KVV13135.1 hypothetical protein AP058_02497 [Flavobacterium sp. TAB 87]
MLLGIVNALGMEVERFCYQNSSTTATRKRPAEAPTVLVVLSFDNKTWSGQPAIRHKKSPSRLTSFFKLLNGMS